tara:strand:- start:1092 stop:1385 length:294 start_codon:yes stop_codon:yes gene_type:complete
MITWTIPNLQRNSSNGGVTIAHYRAVKTDGEHAATSYGSCAFTPDSTLEGFIPYESLTESTVLSWVYTQIDKDRIELHLTAKLEDLKNPPEVLGTPW